MTNAKLCEDVPVTTTTNDGNGLDSPKLPIKQKTILRRYKEMKNNHSDEREIK